jgi:DnaJ-class molecular chaperone
MAVIKMFLTVFRHPDKNKNAESKFVEIHKAYEVLLQFYFQ